MTHYVLLGGETPNKTFISHGYHYWKYFIVNTIYAFNKYSCPFFILHCPCIDQFRSPFLREHLHVTSQTTWFSDADVNLESKQSIWTQYPQKWSQVPRHNTTRINNEQIKRNIVTTVYKEAVLLWCVCFVFAVAPIKAGSDAITWSQALLWTMARSVWCSVARLWVMSCKHVWRT